MDAEFPDRLRKCADEMRREGIVGSAAAGAPLAMEMAAIEIEELRSMLATARDSRDAAMTTAELAMAQRDRAERLLIEQP